MAGPVGGELWPGGPVELPCLISLAGHTYRTTTIPPMKLAYMIGFRMPLLPVILTEPDRQAVEARLLDEADVLDVRECEEASMLLAAQLVGIRRGITGWRAAVRLCSSLVTNWQDCGATLCGRGVDVAGWPLWRTGQALYHALIADRDRVEESKILAATQRMYLPLPDEPAWLQGPTVVRPVSAAKAAANAATLFTQLTGKPLASSDNAPLRSVFWRYVSLGWVVSWR